VNVTVEAAFTVIGSIGLQGIRLCNPTFGETIVVTGLGLIGLLTAQLLLANGLPRRGWYKHSLYAPGFYTGYGVKTLPGIREAIEQRDFKEAQEQINAAAAAINKLADFLKL